MGNRRGWWLAAVVLVGCGKDPGLKAARSECEAACDHFAGLKDEEGQLVGCADLCIQQGWTVGDVTCVADASTKKAAKDCAVVARLVLAHDQQKAIEAARELRLKDEERRRADEARKKAACDCQPGDPLCSCL